MMNFTATARDNGQGTIIVTVPAFLVDSHGIKPGDAVTLKIINPKPKEAKE